MSGVGAFRWTGWREERCSWWPKDKLSYDDIVIRVGIGRPALERPKRHAAFRDRIPERVAGFHQAVSRPIMERDIYE